MKIKNKILTLAIGISALGMIAIPNNVNAALQANGTTGVTDTMGNWMVSIRKMEETGGTLGLTDTINTTSLESSAEKSNNLDIHMEKNTEYGAMAILSASAYGNQNKINSGETTTGNKSGVYIYINKEWVAGGGPMSGSSVLQNINDKYRNIYAATYIAKSGDAIKETEGWHGTTISPGANNYWSINEKYSGIVRSIQGSLFSYHTGAGGGAYADVVSDKNYTRAVIVIGNGF